LNSAKHSGILLSKICIRTMHYLLMVCYADVGYAGVVLDVAEILIVVLIYLREVTRLHWIGHI
jgi:hypothetical protein